MPNSDTLDDDAVVVDVGTLQLATLAAGCPSGNIYDGSPRQPTRQGLRSQAELKDE